MLILRVTCTHLENKKIKFFELFVWLANTPQHFLHILDISQTGNCFVEGMHHQNDVVHEFVVLSYVQKVVCTSIQVEKRTEVFIQLQQSEVDDEKSCMTGKN